MPRPFRPYLLLTFTILLTTACSAAPTKEPTTSAMLDAYQWNHRPIFVFAKDDKTLKAIEQTFAEAKAGILDRDILWFAQSPDARASNAPKDFTDTFARGLKQRFHKNPKAIAETVLVGKDGGVKSRDDTLDLDEIFRRIDAMPMRQAEMRADDL